MKIAFTANQVIKCGGIRVAFEYCQELNKRGHTAEIYANSAEQSIEDWKSRYNVKIRPLADLELGVDVLISLWWVQFDDLTQYPAKRIFHLNQGRDHLSYPDGSFKRQNLLEMQREDYQFISVSKWAGESCKDPQIVPNGVDTNFFTPAKFAKLHPSFRILFESSTADKTKGRQRAIQIMKKLKDEYGQNLELWEITKNPQDESIFDHQITDPNDITIVNAYQNCDILLKTSEFEGFGLSHLEAMACKCAVVTTNSGGNAEFCVDGENCIMSNNDSDLVNGIGRLIQDKEEYNRITENGYHTSLSMTWEKSTDKLLEVIQE
jgi:glycosyltransferase involved in cell wall biosynthesis